MACDPSMLCEIDLWLCSASSWGWAAVPVRAPALARVTCALIGPLKALGAVSGPAAPEHNVSSTGLAQRVLGLA